ncbi:hypothetical protein [Caenispirillum bisanense]|uniref:hypothetical protein n=1 Tax=Caenispirillum bisanense TaxID=414052 RepID=UPI0031D1A69F
MSSNSRLFALLLMVAAVATLITWVATAMAVVVSTAGLGRDAVSVRLELVAGGITRDIAEYAGAGIGLSEAVGVSEYLREELSGDPAVAAALVETPDGRPIGRFIRPDRDDLTATTLDLARLERSGLTAAAFPVLVEGMTVGRVVLAMEEAALPAGLDGAMPHFFVALVTALLFGSHLILTAFRELVERPQQAVLAVQQRVALRQFDASAGAVADGPVAPVAEAVTRVLVAVNDRVARARAYVQELRDFSFNRDAAAAAGTLDERLGRSGTFAPDGMVVLRLDHAALVLGPALFRAALVIALGIWLAARGGLPVALSVAAALLVAAVGGLARLVPRMPRPLFLAGLAAAALVVLPAFPEPWLGLPLLALASAHAFATVATIVCSHPAVRAGAALHAAFGLAAGAGLIHLEHVSGSTWVTTGTAVLALFALAVLGTRHAATAGPPPRPDAAAGRLSLPLLPILFWAGAALWLAAGSGAVGTYEAWAATIAVAVGSSLMLTVLYRWRARLVADVALPVALFGAVVALPLGESVAALMLGGFAVGIGAPAAAGLQALHGGLRGMPWTATAVTLGAVLGGLAGTAGAAVVELTAAGRLGGRTAP